MRTSLWQRLLPFLTLIALFVGLIIATPNFFTQTNLSSVVRQTAVINIMALGMTMVIITGGIDLSVGSILALAGCLGTMTMTSGWPVGVGIAVGILVGCLAGLLGGLYNVGQSAVETPSQSRCQMSLRNSWDCGLSGSRDLRGNFLILQLSTWMSMPKTVGSLTRTRSATKWKTRPKYGLRYGPEWGPEP